MGGGEVKTLFLFVCLFLLLARPRWQVRRGLVGFGLGLA